MVRKKKYLVRWTEVHEYVVEAENELYAHRNAITDAQKGFGGVDTFVSGSVEDANVYKLVERD